MNYKPIAWEFLKTKHRQIDEWVEAFWTGSILLASIVLLTTNLNTLPLNNGHEAIVAQVAKEIWHSPFGTCPTLWGKPYFDHPPLQHWLIASLYSLLGMHEWVIRLPSALFTAFSVVLLYGIGREIFSQRLSALLSAFVYLSLLPIVQQGRLAMLDGPLLFWGLLMVGTVLRSRRDLRYCLGTGLGFSALCLIDGRVAFFWLFLTLLLLGWDTPRLLTCRYAIIGFGLGFIPALTWYSIHFSFYQDLFFNLSSSQRLEPLISSVWESLNPGNDGSRRSILQVLKYAWPWLIFFPFGLREILINKNLGSSKLLLVWLGVFLLLGLLFPNLPGVILSIYPAIALCVGHYLSEVWHNWPLEKPYPRLWSTLLGCFAGCLLLTGLVYHGFSRTIDPYLLAITASGTLTLGIAMLLISQKDLQFIPILCWGTYVSLLILMMSPHWQWQSYQNDDVKPVAAMIQQNVPPSETVYGRFDQVQPALNFYSDRPIYPLSEAQLRQKWQSSTVPYVLITPDHFHHLQLPQAKTLQQSAGWLLITRQKSPTPPVSPKPNPRKSPRFNPPLSTT